jgi:hypothetical protein
LLPEKRAEDEPDNENNKVDSSDQALLYSGRIVDLWSVIKMTAIYTTTNIVKVGVGFGSALAITISWSINKSILWAIFHGFLSWVYVIYYAIWY